ncbi:hypothetical protein B0H63DRAFT_556208 [Podospora didyma]|uniref:Uncharacterized protein n=1 Tax=Podospora didyma TaxID=330526 RepID=A0AAE0P846_9PEZI|nr:hypothetical protein B0H63DRAFT_556208 [Podospora didyma]
MERVKIAIESEEYVSDQMEELQSFVQFVEQTLLLKQINFGWTLIKDPQGFDIEYHAGKLITNPEYINSDVIVDFKEAMSANPRWEPEPPSACPDHPGGFKLIQEFVPETFALGGDIELERDDDDLDEQVVRFNNRDASLSPEDFALLPHRPLAYAIWQRKFAQIDIRHV